MRQQEILKASSTTTEPKKTLRNEALCRNVTAYRNICYMKGNTKPPTLNLGFEVERANQCAIPSFIEKSSEGVKYDLCIPVVMKRFNHRTGFNEDTV